ncbi:MAG: HAMP domain-containing histidine kinase [Bacteroidales bacterium]|nr:HAMP domain-containing histidine kinase [Bacteroidales bacterium]
MKSKTKYTSIEEGGLWLVRLRWLAVVGILMASTFAYGMLKIPVQIIPLIIIAFILLVLNLISFHALKYFINEKTTLKILKAENNVIFQIITDLIILTCLLHYSGGVENPFVIYYVFHMIIASILLSPGSSYFITTIALMFIGTLTLLEYFEIIPHYSLQGFNDHNFYQNTAFLAGTGFIYITTSYLIVYMTVSISTNLRHHIKAYTDAASALEEKDKIKNEYVLRLTHDIKSHVAAIQNSLDVVLLSENERDKRHFAVKAHMRAQKLTAFVRELLRLTRLRLINKIDMKEFSIEESVGKVIQELRPVASDKGIGIDLINELKENKLAGNQISIEEALNNLISNAIKYSPEQSTITVKVSNKRSSLIIEVIDSGIGIPPHEQKLIFNEFYRATNVENIEKDSSGSGLSLVKQIIEMHKGTVSVESKLNKGSRFTITLPAIKSK